MNVNLFQSCFYDARCKGKVLCNGFLKRAWWMNRDYFTFYIEKSLKMLYTHKVLLNNPIRITGENKYD